MGRFTSTYIMRFVSPRRLMGCYSCTNVALLIIAIAFPGWWGMWALLLTSFFMSLMFPTIFSLGLKGLGPNTKLGGSLLVMAVVGGAVFPLAMGWVATKSTMARAMFVPLVSYVFIAYYSFIGAKKVGAAESPAVLADLR